jgi:predicted DNA-binding protein YlxM (UPF0122 family)
MEERVEISVLLDFYGCLLTDKQREIMTIYYDEDLSLGEIAELNNTSRQAIHDAIKRCNKLLLEYESKLQLMEKSYALDKVKQSIIHKCNLIKDKTNEDEIKEYIDDIEKVIIENL